MAGACWLVLERLEGRWFVGIGLVRIRGCGDRWRVGTGSLLRRRRRSWREAGGEWIGQVDGRSRGRSHPVRSDLHFLGTDPFRFYYRPAPVFVGAGRDPDILF